MQYLNLGLPRSGLQSISRAMAMLGIQVRPKKPFTHRDWLDRLSSVELLQGNPFGANYQKVIATLQQDGNPPRLFYSYRPRSEWLQSCERTFRTPSNDVWENDARSRFFNGAITFDENAFGDAYEERLAVARSLAGCILFPLHLPDHLKWDNIRTIAGARLPFPHEGKTPIPLKSPYQPHELVP